MHALLPYVESRTIHPDFGARPARSIARREAFDAVPATVREIYIRSVRLACESFDVRVMLRW